MGYVPNLSHLFWPSGHPAEYSHLSTSGLLGPTCGWTGSGRFNAELTCAIVQHVRAMLVRLVPHINLSIRPNLCFPIGSDSFRASTGLNHLNMTSVLPCRKAWHFFGRGIAIQEGFPCWVFPEMPEDHLCPCAVAGRDIFSPLKSFLRCLFLVTWPPGTASMLTILYSYTKREKMTSPTRMK